MSIFPPGFDPSGDIQFGLNLVTIDTPDGTFGFVIGADGIFTDINGMKWYGSQLIQAGDDEFATEGNAPSGQITMSFFQDPAAPDVISQVRELGADYVDGRDLIQWVLPMKSQAEFYAPTVAPIRVMTRTMRQVVLNLQEGQQRTIGVTYEASFERRRDRRRLIWNTTDHALLIGGANPSLQFVPQIYDQEEKLF